MNTIFITGASSGLGKATVKLFAKKGWSVIATMRHPDKEDELSNIPNVHLFSLDVTNAENVKKLSEEIVTNYDIDIVFNNAGYGLSGPFEGTSEEQIYKNINTNLLGVMRVTQAFLPHFRKKGRGMFINTTSFGGTVTMPFNSIYHATKFAVEGWSESLSFELEPLGIRVKTIAPGNILTDFGGRSMDMSQHEGYEKLLNKYNSVLRNPERRNSYSTPEQIAEIVYEAATDGKPQIKYIAGEDAKNYFKMRESLGQEGFRNVVKKLFFG